MGFTTGFTGGVTLTLGVAYLTLLAHQRNRDQQAAVLRQQTYLLSSIVDPLPPALPPTRAELAAAERANFAEAAKDRWNAEIEHAVRWAQARDWDAVRDDVETAASRLWARALGEAPEDNAADTRKPTRENHSGSSNVSVAAAAKSAYADAKVTGSELASAAEKKADEAGEAAKNSIIGAIGKGIEKGKGFLSGAKSDVVAVVTDAKAEPEPSSPVEKALQQRYQKPSGLDRTAEEVLAARYTPIDQKDSTNLKAL
ncbi:hypothetical protein F5Y14DRAFT_436978 [Nemania sp. NC0429]|nr:hypothetical protein F5Y14DRAFT_436978 [Nemania sp. NC0429]